MTIPAESTIIITCSNRLSIYLQQEVEALGFVPEKVFKTGLQLVGSLEDCIVLNLNLRCASQVHYSITSFTAANADDLYKEASTIAWEDIIPMTTLFSITSNVTNETIDNNLFANVRLKDAIVDRFRAQVGERPDSGSSLTGLVIHLYWKDDIAEIFIDTSGETLSKHGYRKIPGKAPMLESLAAATVYATGWDGASVFVNPMCGSGTLAIEAAMMATGRRPGLYRSNYSFMHVKGFDENIYNKHYENLEKAVKPAHENCRILASDISEDAIEITLVNAGFAGVEDLITTECCDFEICEIPIENKGVIMFNPEYGERLGEEAELEITYKKLGDFLKQKCKGYMGYIFTGNLELAKKIGLKPKRRIEFFNGRIDCRLLQYELYEGTREVKD